MDKHEAKFWRPDILGWSDDILPYYEKIVSALSDDAIILEIGIFEGRSALFMIEEIAKSKKSIQFYGIDINPCPKVLREQKITFIQRSSKEASTQFIDSYFDFIFIDGLHKYEDVLDDIKIWLPKVSADGILAGHDYCNEEYTAGSQNLKVGAHPDVIKAVDESFGAENINHPTRTVWEYIVK